MINEIIKETLKSCVKNKHYNEVINILKKDNFNPSFEDNILLKMAFQNFNYDAFLLIEHLLNDKRVYLLQSSLTVCLIHCTFQGYDIYTELLLKHAHCNPYLYDNRAFVIACLQGNPKIVKLFVKYCDYDFKFDHSIKNPTHSNYYVSVIYKSKELRTTFLEYLKEYHSEEEIKDMTYEFNLQLIQDKASDF